jgi:hypothetical protein
MTSTWGVTVIVCSVLEHKTLRERFVTVGKQQEATSVEVKKKKSKQPNGTTNNQQQQQGGTKTNTINSTRFQTARSAQQSRIMDERNAVRVQFAVKVEVAPPKSTVRSSSSGTKISQQPNEGRTNKATPSKSVQFASGGGDGGGKRPPNATGVGSSLERSTASRHRPATAAIPRRTKQRSTQEGVPVFGCPVTAARLGRRPASANNRRLANPEPIQQPDFYIPTGDLVNRDYAIIDMDLERSLRRKDEWAKTEQPQMCRRERDRPEYLQTFRPKEDRTTYLRPFLTNGAVLRPPPPPPSDLYSTTPWSKACRDDEKLDARAVPHQYNSMTHETFQKYQEPRAPQQHNKVLVSQFAAANNVVNELASSRKSSRVLLSSRK